MTNTVIIMNFLASLTMGKNDLSEECEDVSRSAFRLRLIINTTVYCEKQ